MNEISFSLKGDFIELYKLLKITGVCDSGGAAKHAISEGLIKVDGDAETRKAFKVRRGQTIEFQSEKILVR